MAIVDVIVIYLVASSTWEAKFKAEPVSAKAKLRMGLISNVQDAVDQEMNLRMQSKY